MSGRKIVVLDEIVDAAERVAEIVARSVGYGVKQLLGVAGILLGRSARLDDRDGAVADAPRGAHRRMEVLGADAPVHARDVIRAGQDVAERVEHHENHSKYDLPCHWLDPTAQIRRSRLIEAIVN